MCSLCHCGGNDTPWLLVFGFPHRMLDAVELHLHWLNVNVSESVVVPLFTASFIYLSSHCFCLLNVQIVTEEIIWPAAMLKKLIATSSNTGG